MNEQVLRRHNIMHARNREFLVGHSTTEAVCLRRISYVASKTVLRATEVARYMRSSVVEGELR